MGQEEQNTGSSKMPKSSPSKPQTLKDIQDRLILNLIRLFYRLNFLVCPYFKGMVGGGERGHFAVSAFSRKHFILWCSLCVTWYVQILGGIEQMKDIYKGCHGELVVGWPRSE